MRCYSPVSSLHVHGSLLQRTKVLNTVCRIECGIRECQAEIRELERTLLLMKNDVFKLVLIKFQSVTVHPVSDMSQTCCNVLGHMTRYPCVSSAELWWLS